MLCNKYSSILDLLVLIMKLLEEMLTIKELHHNLQAFTHIWATKKRKKKRKPGTTF